LLQFLDAACVFLSLAETRSNAIQFRGYYSLFRGAQRTGGLAKGAPTVSGWMRPPGPSIEEIVVDRLWPVGRCTLVVPAASQSRPENAQRASWRYDKKIAVGQLDSVGADSIPIPPALENLAVPRRPYWSLLHFRCHRFCFEIRGRIINT